MEKCNFLKKKVVIKAISEVTAEVRSNKATLMLQYSIDESTLDNVMERAIDKYVENRTYFGNLKKAKKRIYYFFHQYLKNQKPNN